MTEFTNSKFNKWFDTEHLSGNLKAHSIRGGMNTIIGQVASFAMNISSTIIMARLLTPGDYGLVAMVTTVTGFITIFKDMGLSAAIIQRKQLFQDQVSAVFWINILVSLGLASIIALIAPLLVIFYDEERVFNMTIVFAASIFFSGLSLQHNALMKRQMKFKSLSKIQVLSTILSLATGIILAWQGFGYWSIVAVAVTNPIYSTIALWIVCDWRPNLTFKSKGIKSIITFGAGLTGFDFVNYFSRNLDNVLIGKFVGASALGMYSKAYQLLLLPITQLRDPLNAVALPALSSLQHEKWKYNSYFTRYLFTLAFFSMPIVAFFAIYSDEIVSIVLGSKWIGVSSIFKLLAIAAFIQPIASTQGLILITTGKSKKYFTLGIINTSVVVTGFCIGVNWGVIGVAISYSIVTYLLFIPLLYYCLKDSPVTVKQFLLQIIYPSLFSIVSGLFMFSYKYFVVDLPPLVTCGIGFFIGASVYLSLWFTSRFTRTKLEKIRDISSFASKDFKGNAVDTKNFNGE